MEKNWVFTGRPLEHYVIIIFVVLHLAAFGIFLNAYYSSERLNILIDKKSLQLQARTNTQEKFWW